MLSYFHIMISKQSRREEKWKDIRIATSIAIYRYYYQYETWEALFICLRYTEKSDSW